MAAWLAVGKELAVVSHDSALDLLGLSDVIPDAVHLTVPRARRKTRALLDTIVHTTTRPLRPGDLTEREGIRLTSPARTILDAAEIGVAPSRSSWPSARRRSVASSTCAPCGATGWLAAAGSPG